MFLFSDGTPLRLGCFKDDDDRDLSGYSTGSQQNSVEWCAAVCKRHRYIYAGVQAGYNCYCGNSVGRYGLSDPSICNIPCNANRRQKCGGHWRQDVYYLGAAVLIICNQVVQ